MFSWLCIVILKCSVESFQDSVYTIVLFQLVELLENKEHFSTKNIVFIHHSIQRLSHQHMYLFLVRCQKP